MIPGYGYMFRGASVSALPPLTPPVTHPRELLPNIGPYVPDPGRNPVTGQYMPRLFPKYAPTTPPMTTIPPSPNIPGFPPSNVPVATPAPPGVNGPGPTPGTGTNALNNARNVPPPGPSIPTSNPTSSWQTVGPGPISLFKLLTTAAQLVRTGTPYGLALTIFTYAGWKLIKVIVTPDDKVAVVEEPVVFSSTARDGV